MYFIGLLHCCFNCWAGLCWAVCLFDLVVLLILHVAVCCGLDTCVLCCVLIVWCLVVLVLGVVL